jgi:hypothetical protein
VIPTFPFFIALPIMLRSGLGFYVSMTLSTVIMLACYILMTLVLKQFGMRL